MTHTPGPWRWDSYLRQILGPDDRSLGDYRYRQDSEVIANRRLQVAAPDLYEALEEIAFRANIAAGPSGDIPDEVVPEVLRDIFRHITTLARPALAAARGEQP